MMALTDEELALYQRMDAERKGREEKEWADECKRMVGGPPTGAAGTGTAGPRSRLMTEKDAPSWLRDADSQMALDVASGKAAERNGWQLDGATGGAGRKRKEISYRDQFTDTEFIKMCEVGVEEEEAEAEAAVGRGEGELAAGSGQ
ncbi:unnamed protein product [Phytophthora lilii]|uniref:Unnamed protein product n=1 Tax=Phytophthora lilii TaxID=2077276 RepID=A0A9W6X6D1_9STRA|nr:unnamed protein product [Phytophthora lilii]